MAKRPSAGVLQSVSMSNSYVADQILRRSQLRPARELPSRTSVRPPSGTGSTSLNGPFGLKPKPLPEFGEVKSVPELKRPPPGRSRIEVRKPAVGRSARIGTAAAHRENGVFTRLEHEGSNILVEGVANLCAWQTRSKEHVRPHQIPCQRVENTDIFVNRKSRAAVIGANLIDCRCMPNHEIHSANVISSLRACGSETTRNN